MKARILISAIAALGLAGAAQAATPEPAKTNRANCFLSSNWENWRGADANTIYLRINIRDIYKVELSGGSPMVTDSFSHLINHMRGSDWVCGPLDLDLKISDGSIVVPLFVKSITKLTPEEVAMIPKKAMP